MGTVTINKVEEGSPLPPPQTSGSARKTRRTKTYPKGILKIKPVSDPAKPPPLKKTAKNTTVQILTERGAKSRRKTIRRKIKQMNSEQVKTLAEKHGLVKNKKVPAELIRHIVEGGVIAGFISLDK